MGGGDDRAGFRGHISSKRYQGYWGRFFLKLKTLDAGNSGAVGVTPTWTMWTYKQVIRQTGAARARQTSYGITYMWNLKRSYK